MMTIETNSLTLNQANLVQASIVRDQENIVSDMGGEKVILSIRNGNYYNLGIMGSQIWELIQEPIPVMQLIDKLIEQYDVDRITCEEQLLPFLLHLSEEKLIHYSL
ncbi:lasso peptide biosynthesis PqqD family chaperone [Paenibacillus sp. FSL K6-3182]|uniref:lasso peptide biosynthesis PqqD family chaperone n=1 Tax=unclassified Paenibacillus TaxID=185978 RepID=UPI0030CC1126